jgi:hypothetical protein
MEWSGRALALPAISWPGRLDTKHAISATPQKPTDHSTTPTLDRLEAALKERGFTISPELITLPHGGHGSEDPAATALLFGNRASAPLLSYKSQHWQSTSRSRPGVMIRARNTGTIKPPVQQLAMATAIFPIKSGQ